MANEILKRLDYGLGFLGLMVVGMTASRWGQGSDFYPLWLIFGCLGGSLMLLFWRQWLSRKPQPPSFQVPAGAREKRPRDEKSRQLQRQEDEKLEEQAHDFIVRLCQSKNIELHLEQAYRNGGHYEIPEIWVMEKAVPLTPDELYAITLNRVLNVVTELQEDDKIVYARNFSRNGGWVSYQIGKKTN